MMKFAKTRPEMFWSIVGAAVGTIPGFLVGGMGIAAGGGARGVSSSVVLIIFAVIGGLGGQPPGHCDWPPARTGIGLKGSIMRLLFSIAVTALVVIGAFAAIRYIAGN
ncbi:hypothetical protein [Bradyrhizobium sp. USDA 10063]